MTVKGRIRCSACDASPPTERAPEGACANRCNGTVRQGPRKGLQCGVHVQPGGKVCRKHGGNAPQVVAARKRRHAMAEVQATVTKLGVALDVDPGEALLTMVYEAVGNVAAYRTLVGELGLELTDTEYSQSGAKDVAHIKVRLYNDERDRLANHASMAIKAGIDERRVRMAETTTNRLAEAVSIALDAAGLTPQQREDFTRALAVELRRLT